MEKDHDKNQTMTASPEWVTSLPEARDPDTCQMVKYQHEINDRGEKTLKIGIFNAMKYGWTLRGIDCGRCRAPFKELTDEQKKIITEFFAGRS